MTATLTRSYAPRGACRDLLECQDREVLVSGPAGTGKSRACLEKLHTVAMGVPGVRLLMIRKTLVSLTATGLVTFREQVANRSIERGELKWFGGSMQEPAAYRYQNGSVLVVGGMDKATKIMSSEYDMIYVQEAIELTLNDWEALTTRLRYGRLPYQQLIADTNPDTPTHWLNQRCTDGATRMLESRHSDNPRLFDDDGQPTTFGADYLAALDSLTGVRKDRLRFGRWVAAEGMIFEGYDATIHVVDPFDIPREWPRFWSVDFGFTNPMVVQRWAQDGDGRLYLYAEDYITKTLVEDLSAELKDKILPHEPRPRWVVCDHDAEDRATFERHTGLTTTAANKKVSEGLQAVASRLKVAGDKRPRVMFLRDACKRRDQALVDARKPASTIEEIPGYVWSDKRTKEEPVKADDHGCDALRYCVAKVDLGARPRLRWVG